MTIEQMIAAAVDRAVAGAIEEAVKNAVSEALSPVKAQLDGIEEKVSGMSRELNFMDKLATEDELQRIRSGLFSTLDEITDEIKRADLNKGRAEISAAVASGRYVR